MVPAAVPTSRSGSGIRRPTRPTGTLTHICPIRRAGRRWARFACPVASTCMPVAAGRRPSGPVPKSDQRSLLADIRFHVYSLGVEWEIEATDEFFAWAEALERSDVEARDMLDAVIDVLAERGPMMRRPYVGEIVTSRHHNMKELLVPPAAWNLGSCSASIRGGWRSCCSGAIRARIRCGTPGIRKLFQRQTTCMTSTSLNSDRRGCCHERTQVLVG